MNKNFTAQKTKILLLIFISIPVTFFDLITKKIIENNFTLHESINVIGDFFKLTYIRNKGAAFGIEVGSPLIFNILSFSVVTLILFYFWKSKFRKLESISFSLIIGGAFGNLYERIFVGSVVDFLDFGIGSKRWPAFNAADSAITIGVILFIASEIFVYSKEKPMEDEISEIEEKENINIE